MTDVIKIRSSAKAKAKSKSKSKSKSKASSSANANVTVRIGRDGKSRRRQSTTDKPKDKQQPIIINNMMQSALPSLSDRILIEQKANQNAPMRMSDNQPYVPSTTAIPSSIPSITPMGQPIATHRSNTIQNSVNELESDYRDFKSEVMSEVRPDTAERVLRGVRQMLDDYRNIAPNLPPSQMPNNLMGNNPLEDVINQMSNLTVNTPSTQSVPSASMGADSSSSSGSPPAPPPPQLQLPTQPTLLQLPAPNEADQPMVDEPVTSVQESNSPQSMQSVQMTASLPRLRIQGNPQPLALGPIPSDSSDDLSSDKAPTSSVGSYNPLFDDFGPGSVAPTQDLNPQGSVDTTQVVQGSVGTTQNLNPTEVVEGSVGTTQNLNPTEVVEGSVGTTQNLNPTEAVGDDDDDDDDISPNYPIRTMGGTLQIVETFDITVVLDEIDDISSERKVKRDNNLRQQSFNLLNRTIKQFYKDNINPNFTGNVTQAIRDQVRNWISNQTTR